MPITSQNAILNQYVPPFCVDTPVSGQTFVYDPIKKTWENKALSALDLGGLAPEDLIWGNTYSPGDVVTISDDTNSFMSTPRSEFGGEGGGASKLNDLSDVSVIAPILDGHAFVYRTDTEKWTNTFIDYDKLVNIPTEFVPSLHNHTKSEISDFDEADYATSAQGLLADSALQSGSPVSELSNDVGYLTNINSESIDNLADVTTVGILDGQSLVWTGTGFIPGDPGVKAFELLEDTPPSYIGQAGKMVTVNDDETGLEYQDVPTPPAGTITSMDFGTFDNENARMDAGAF